MQNTQFASSPAPEPAPVPSSLGASPRDPQSTLSTLPLNGNQASTQKKVRQLHHCVSDEAPYRCGPWILEEPWYRPARLDLDCIIDADLNELRNFVQDQVKHLEQRHSGVPQALVVFRYELQIAWKFRRNKRLALIEASYMHRV
ncbi:hypothetical protein OC834_007474, partial [Tilletia horrida]